MFRENEEQPKVQNGFPFIQSSYVLCWCWSRM